MLRIDPRLAILWRSPADLQIGFDPAGPVLHRVTAAEDRLLDVLRTGAESAGHAAVLAGATERAASDLLDRLAGALEAVPAAALPVRLRIVDDHERTAVLAHRLGTALAVSGARPAPVDTRIALEVLVGRYAIRPTASSPFLAADAPHLAVVATDGRIRVGPLVRPGRTACLQCVARAAVELDPALPALLAQTVGGATPPLLDTAAALLRAAALVAAAAASAGPAVASIAAVDAAGAIAELTTVQPHARCGCRVLADQRDDTESVI